jgi:CubicO group peptidase (beta-lactamase class C family)
MPLNRRVVLAVGLGLSSCARGPSTPAPVTAAAALEAYADSLLHEYAAPDGPGASVIILRHGAVLLKKSYGLANLEDQRAATPTTNYRLASVTKQFTAMAILLVAQDGRLSLDDTITRFFADLPPALRGMTVRHLLTHTSGLLDYEDLIPPSQTEQVHDADVLDLLRSRDSTLFLPGERFEYSNSGYVLLGLIVEQASGRPFPDFLKERIFTPLGMARSVALVEGVSTVDERAYGYSKREGGESGWELTDQSVTSATLGDGGVYTSIEDMARWANALDAGTLVRAGLLEQAFTPGRLNDGSRTDYGFGWFVKPFLGRPSTFHTGTTVGFRNAIRRLPDQGITVIILTNRNDGDPLTQVDKLAERLLAAE